MSLRRRRGDSAPPPIPGYTGKMPLYSLGINNRGFAVAGGGGGASKTGIPNGLIFFKYNQEKIEKIGEHHTSADAITSLDVHPEENLALFIDTDKFAKVQFAAGGTVIKTETIENPLASKVKVLRFSPDASKVALAGFDGSLNIVSYPSLTTAGSAPKAHTDDIDDVAWDPSGKLLATASKDKTAKIFHNGIQVKHTLSCEAEGTVLMPRGCRFSPACSSSPSRLFVSAFIISKATYIFAWNPESGALIKKAKIHNYHCASFAIGARGSLVAVGDVDGTVVVANSTTLNKVMQVKPHGFFVPALAFTPPIKAPTGSTRPRTSTKSSSQPTQVPSDGAIISVGADYACMFTPIVPQNFVDKRLIIFILTIFVALLAIFIKYFFLK